MNLGVSDVIKNKFKFFKPVERPTVHITEIPDPNWVSGFVCGEGNFDVGIRESNNNVGFQVVLRFRITQHIRDTELMNLLINYLGVGRLENDTRGSIIYLVVARFSDLNQKIIPFFNQYPINGIKHLDFLDWCKIANLINIGSHLTTEGLEEIRRIKSGMNKGRK